MLINKSEIRLKKVVFSLSLFRKNSNNAYLRFQIDCLQIESVLFRARFALYISVIHNHLNITY